ncbi:hypothetical protein F5I97DRAFT_1933823 [Phlebopus sp. FC_14]|nr:hypothetical protein F5I97DRAFT_1933823 [Phlebopus sp. FC_14]
MSSGSASKGVALVTGSARGIGRSIALQLAADGYDIALNDVPVNKDAVEALGTEITSKHPGRRTRVLLADVSDEKDVKAMVEGVVGHFGKLDVMVANAGVVKVSTLLDTTTQDWDSALAVNARGTFLCYKYAAQQMIAQGTKGRIIGASSLSGKKGGFTYLSAYSASKFAVRGLTHVAATELGRYGITVNAYAPGAIDTEMLGQIQTYHVEKTEEGIYAKMKELAAVGYLGQPKDVASLVSYLVTPEAHFITGKRQISRRISVDGGVYYD